jgi:hypothetical protein
MGSRILTKDRGSYCCAPLTVANNRTLLLGISHSKFVWKGQKTRHSLPGNVSANHFFSSFYLMESFPPYTVLARSGKFCLGFPSKEEMMENPYSGPTMQKRLRLASDDFDCPAIHFVSGLVDTPDGEHFIIAYGVNDCAPRMVKVRKSDILKLLFPYGETPQEAATT